MNCEWETKKMNIWMLPVVFWKCLRRSGTCWIPKFSNRQEERSKKVRMHAECLSTPDFLEMWSTMCVSRTKIIPLWTGEIFKSCEKVSNDDDIGIGWMLIMSERLQVKLDWMKMNESVRSWRKSWEIRQKFSPAIFAFFVGWWWWWGQMEQSQHGLTVVDNVQHMIDGDKRKVFHFQTIYWCYHHVITQIWCWEKVKICTMIPCVPRSKKVLQITFFFSPGISMMSWLPFVKSLTFKQAIILSTFWH